MQFDDKECARRLYGKTIERIEAVDAGDVVIHFTDSTAIRMQVFQKESYRVERNRFKHYDPIIAFYDLRDVVLPPEEPKKVRLPKTEVIYVAAMARSAQLKGPLCPICEEPQHEGDCR